MDWNLIRNIMMNDGKKWRPILLLYNNSSCHKNRRTFILYIAKYSMILSVLDNYSNYKTDKRTTSCYSVLLPFQILHSIRKNLINNYFMNECLKKSENYYMSSLVIEYT